MNSGAKYSSKSGLWQLPASSGHYSARPVAHQWGHAAMVLFLTDLSIAWYYSGFGTGGRHPFGIGDISFEDGSAPPVHHTHIYGSCVDIYVMHRNGARRSDSANKITFQDADYDVEATRALASTAVRILNRGYQCVQFLYDDPEVKSVWNRITTSQARPHHDHFHIQLNYPNPYRGREKEVLTTPMPVRLYGF